MEYLPSVKYGYPEKIYYFIGETEIETGGRNVARRNRPRFKVPKYKAADGETIVDMQQSEALNFKRRKNK